MREAAKVAPTDVWTQIEVENFDQHEATLAAGAKMILLDNMNAAQMATAVNTQCFHFAPYRVDYGQSHK